MVSSIVPGVTGAGVLAVDRRLARTPVQDGRSRDGGGAQDRVELSGPAAFAASRESVANGLAQVQQALTVARDAQTTLLKVADPNATQSDLATALQDYGARYNVAAETNGLVRGQTLSVSAEPGSPPLSIAGSDLSLGGEVLGISSSATSGNGALAIMAQGSLDRLQGVLDKLSEANGALQAHQGFLGVAQNANSSVTDLNADSARLLALQVRQGLEAAGNRPIANVEPQAVLALFRA
ncbi:MAG: hypothetical protein HY054_14985 [Proteobacteria bacterium]|nr:hypothetical protein [Pseudomonadota bacterium]